MPFHRLSDESKPSIDKGSTLVMVGSFAPVHKGHLDAMMAAKNVMESLDEDVAAVILAPNSDSYVSQKLDDKKGEWNFARRVLEFDGIYSPFSIPAFIDDISGLRPPEKTITETVIANTKRELGIQACRIVLVVGSDRAESMRPHLENSRAICVLRPGDVDCTRSLFRQQWFTEAVTGGQYIVTDREDPYNNITSTDIRKGIIQSPAIEAI